MNHALTDPFSQAVSVVTTLAFSATRIYKYLPNFSKGLGRIYMFEKLLKTYVRECQIIHCKLTSVDTLYIKIKTEIHHTEQKPSSSLVCQERI